MALHKLLAELADAGVTHAAMEASSHGLDQHRLDGVRLSAGAFTNLGRDHMDYHPTVEEYHAAKLRLFRDLLPKGAPAVVFADDPWSQATVDAARAAGLASPHSRRPQVLGEARRRSGSAAMGSRKSCCLPVFLARY